MNLNGIKSVFNKNTKTYITYEEYEKYEKNDKFFRPGYSRMSNNSSQKLKKHFMKPNSYAQIINDKAYGVICCVKTTDSNDPLVLAVRSIKFPSYLGLPKGRLNNESESEVNCALRELSEETSVDASNYIDSKIYTTDKYTFVSELEDYEWKMNDDYPDESKRPIGIYYKEVKYFLAILPEKVELKPQIEEILECKWIQLSELKKYTTGHTTDMLTFFFESKKVKSKLMSSDMNIEIKKSMMFTPLQNMLKKKSNNKDDSKKDSKSKSKELMEKIFTSPFNKKKSSMSSSSKSVGIKQKGFFNFFKKNK